jgi:hypothetical protein
MVVVVMSAAVSALASASPSGPWSLRGPAKEEETAVAAAPSQLALPVSRAGFAVSPLSARTGLRLSGQADLCTVDLLQQAIAALPPGADEIHLQLACLEYIDVAATRELVALAVRPPCPRLVLHYPPPVLLRLLQLCWPEARARVDIGTTRPDSTWTAGPADRGHAASAGMRGRPGTGEHS